MATGVAKEILLKKENIRTRNRDEVMKQIKESDERERAREQKRLANGVRGERVMKVVSAGRTRGDRGVAKESESGGNEKRKC